MIRIRTRRPDPVWSRREFLRVAGIAAAAFAVPGCSSSEDACDPRVAGPCLPDLGGAPDDHDGHVIAAFVDTIVPGAYRDPMGAPGGIDVGAPALFFDPDLPALGFVPLLVAYIDGTSRKLMDGRNFDELLPDARDTVVAQALDDFAPLEFAVQMAKLAYYSSPPAHGHLGYPGANSGYLGDPELSFGRAMAVEITGDGNLP